MPTENKEIVNRNFADIFSGGMRYEIPFFQRGYAWQSQQWNELKRDVDEQILEAVENDDFGKHEHFFGPVVVLEKPGGHSQVKTFQVIDGQQRITTVYLMLAYIRKQMKKHFHQSPDAQKYYQQLGKWLVNEEVTDTHGDDYWKMKVFSTKGNRLATYYAVFGREGNPQTPTLAEDLQLYVPDAGRIHSFNTWLDRNFARKSATYLWRWTSAITQCLKVVWIPLDAEKDDSQAIFESLNAKGTALTAAELLCNYLFKSLIDEGSRRHEILHSEKWLKPQHKFKENKYFEEYLRHLFSIGEPKAIGKGRRVYVRFKSKHRNLDSGEAARQLENIASSANIYIQIAGHPDAIHLNGDPPATNMLEKIRETNMASCRPFLLAILQEQQKGRLTEADANILMQEAYVLLVRRKVTEVSVTKYDSFFPSLLGKVINEPNKIRAMHQAMQESLLRVSDQEFGDAFTRRAIYRPNEINFTRLILCEIDTYMANEAHGELPGYPSLDTVEHIAPQTLTDDWKRELGDLQLGDLQSVKINTIGNLCLRSRKANSGMGQNSFIKKKEMLRESPSLLAHDIAKRDGPWNIAAIDERSKFLAEKALQIWKWADN